MDEGARQDPASRQLLDRAVAGRIEHLIGIRRRVHAHPELSHQETATTRLVIDELAHLGITGTVLPAGTGVVADIGTGDRLVALRADIDALPLPEESGLPFASTVADVSHACGHDVHLTVLLGAAAALTALPRLPGRVRLIFQPAEEVMPGGAHDVVEAGVMAGVERVFALHCDPRLEVGKVGLRAGAITSASDLVQVEVSGRGGHTARPHLTADLVYGLGLLITGLPGLLSRRLDPRNVPIMVWGMVGAGAAPNAIPQRGVLAGTLRMMGRAGWDQAEPMVRELVAALLEPTGLEHTVIYQRGVPPVVNDAFSAHLLAEAVTAAVGTENLTDTEQSTGGEDFAVLLEQAPGAMARLGVWDGVAPQVDLHSPTFRADERAIGVGARVLAEAALGALQAPSG